MTSIAVVDVRVTLEALSYRFRKLQKHLQKAVDAEVNGIVNSSVQGPHQDYASARKRLAELKELIEESDSEEKACLSKMLYRASDHISQMSVKVDSLIPYSVRCSYISCLLGQKSSYHM